MYKKVGYFSKGIFKKMEKDYESNSLEKLPGLLEELKNSAVFSGNFLNILTKCYCGIATDERDF